MCKRQAGSWGASGLISREQYLSPWFALFARCIFNVSLTDQRHSLDNEGREEVPAIPDRDQIPDQAFAKLCMCVCVCLFLRVKYWQYTLHTTSKKPWRNTQKLSRKKRRSRYIFDSLKK